MWLDLKSLKIMNEPKSLTNEIDYDDRMIKKNLQRVKVTVYTKKMIKKNSKSYCLY